MEDYLIRVIAKEAGVRGLACVTTNMANEAARRQVLSRLLELNHARYAEEVAAGLHENKKGKKGRAKAEARGEEEEGQLGLF